MQNKKSQYQTGEKAPDGFYVCMSCEGNNPVTITMPHDGNRSVKGAVLPECKKCGVTDWYKA